MGNESVQKHETPVELKKRRIHFPLMGLRTYLGTRSRSVHRRRAEVHLAGMRANRFVCPAKRVKWHFRKPITTGSKLGAVSDISTAPKARSFRFYWHRRSCQRFRTFALQLPSRLRYVLSLDSCFLIPSNYYDLGSYAFIVRCLRARP